MQPPIAASAARRMTMLDRPRIRKVFEKRFTARRMAEDYVSVYRRLIAGREAVTAETGVIVPERSPRDLARAVRSLLDDPARLARMRAQAVQRARERFDIALHARGVERFYAEVLGRPS